MYDKLDYILCHHGWIALGPKFHICLSLNLQEIWGWKSAYRNEIAVFMCFWNICQIYLLFFIKLFFLKIFHILSSLSLLKTSFSSPCLEWGHIFIQLLTNLVKKVRIFEKLKCFPSKFVLSLNSSFSVYSLFYLPRFFHFSFSTPLGPLILTILIYLISTLHWNSKHKIALHVWLRNQLFKIQIIFRIFTDYIHALFDRITGNQCSYSNSKQKVCYIRRCSLIYLKY